MTHKDQIETLKHRGAALCSNIVLKIEKAEEMKIRDIDEMRQ